MHNHSYENEFNLHVNEISFSYEKMGTKTRFQEEAKGNSEMAYYKNCPLVELSAYDNFSHKKKWEKGKSGIENSVRK